MAFKYKLKEQEQDLPQVSKGGNFKVGDIKISGGTKYTVRDIDPETGSISWKVENVPAIGTTFKEFQELRKFITTLSRETKDQVIDSIADDIRLLFNKYRTHIRKNYPESYKKFSMNEEEIDEMSTSAGAGSYLTKYAFKKPGKEGVKDNVYVKKFGYKLVPKDKNGNYVQKGSGLEVKNF